MAVRPGITGPWQVSGRSETSYAQRVALDVAYVTHPSLLTDVKILLRTPAAVLARRGAY
jgi:lipopolysaccharide/colanic/teichoic acid biosynthesis glycosyltransferase